VDDDEDLIRVLIHPVADGQVVGLVRGQLLIIADTARREAGLEGDDIVLHQVTESVVRWVVERLGEDEGQAVGVGVVIRHIEIGAGVRAVGQAEAVSVVAVIVELISQGGQTLSHPTLFDEIVAAGVVQKDDADGLKSRGEPCSQEKREQNEQNGK